MRMVMFIRNLNFDSGFVNGRKDTVPGFLLRVIDTPREGSVYFASRLTLAAKEQRSVILPC